MRTNALQIARTGAPEVLEAVELELAPTAAGEVRLRHTSIGLNYIDVYFRTGAYQLPSLPAVLGLEAAGVVEELGAGVTSLAVGERVAYAQRPMGAYCARRNFPADKLVKLPASIGDDVAAASMLKGMTARYLVRGAFQLQRGHVALVHAAAGGVATFLVPWAKHLGARVVGVVGSDEKRALATKLGCDRVVVAPRESFVDAVKELTDGRGADVAYDSVGKDTFDGSLDALAVRGTLASFGQASGKVPPFELARLSARSLTLTRPTLFDYVATRAELEATARDLFDVLERRIVTLDAARRYPLAQAARAHADLEGRRTSGPSVLVP